MPNTLVAPHLPGRVPIHRSAIRRAVGVTGLRLLGWRVEGNFADVDKQVVIVAPHTSNWDFVVGFLVYLAVQLDATWFGKHSLFRWPLGMVFRHFGGIPIERTRSTNVVDLYVNEFNRRDRMVLAIAPEGTRTRVPEWKSGFYHIARGAGVPITPVALDYSARVVRFSAPMVPGSDMAADIARLRAHFSPAMAKDPRGYADVSVSGKGLAG